MFKGIHHIAIIVSSEKSVYFYQKLGFEEMFRKLRDYDTVVLLKDANGTVLELFIDPNHSRRKEDTEPLGLRYLSFIVDNIEETVDESRMSHKIVNPIQSALVNEERAENNHKVVMPVTNTEIATSLTLTTYCWADVLRFCKTTNRHKQVVLKDNADVCLTKIIKHKKRLTMQCRNMLQYGYIKSNAKMKTRNG